VVDGPDPDIEEQAQSIVRVADVAVVVLVGFGTFVALAVTGFLMLLIAWRW